MVAKLAARLSLGVLAVSLLILMLPVEVEGRRQSTLLTLSHLLTPREVFLAAVLYALVVLYGMKASVSGIWYSLGRLPLWAIILLSLVPLGVVASGVIRLSLHPDEIPYALKLLPYAVWAAAGLKLAILIPSTILLVRMRLAPHSLILKWFCACTAVGVCLFVFGCWAIPTGIYSGWALAAQVFCLLPLVRVVIAPIFVHRGRHQ